MTDYQKATGNTGTMMIRDTGSTVEFWLNSGNNSSYNYALPWAWIANGTTTPWLSYRYASNDGWDKLGSITVSTSQTVTLKIGDTGTGGMGGPTTLAVAISRASAPAAPSAPKLSAIASTSLTVTFTDGANNGSAITSRQIGYGTSSTSTQTIISSDGSTAIAGLTPGVKYYFWARTHNSIGYSPWAGPVSTTMLNVPSAPAAPLLSSVTATSIDVSFEPPSSTGGSPITGYDIGYNALTTISAPSTVFPVGSSPQVLPNLQPGKQYYIFVRAKNAVGNGAWSLVATATTVAGVYVLVGTTWKLAVAYVNVGGTWTGCETWVRSVGTWNRSL